MRVEGFGEIVPMALRFKTLTGIDPFSAYLPSGAEKGAMLDEQGQVRGPVEVTVE